MTRVGGCFRENNSYDIHIAHVLCPDRFPSVEILATAEGILQIGAVPPAGEAHVFADRKLTVAGIMSVLFGEKQIYFPPPPRTRQSHP